ncbi:MAG: alpha/beta hydrolase [Betaproteobacteria bacterium]
MHSPTIRLGATYVALALLCAVPGSAAAQLPLPEFRGSLASNEELIHLETRQNVITRVHLTKPASAPKGIVLHFPGGEGFLVNASGNLYGAFRRELAAGGYVVAVLDVPSDHPDGLGSKGEIVETFRVGAEHTQDARVIVDKLHARWPAPVYLMGHSMGAISASHLAASLDDKRLAGVILLGSPSERGPRASWVSIPSAALDRITVPVVVVHHRNDGCRGSTFATASRYPQRFTASPRVGFIEVVGGDSPSADPCSGSNYHSFFGRRREVMEAIVRWIAGESISRVGD